MPVETWDIAEGRAKISVRKISPFMREGVVF
jgi:hypothetical protein